MIPGLIAAILLISMGAIMSQAVVRERARGTLEQMLVTPITRGEYLLGKVLPYVFVAIDPDRRSWRSSAATGSRCRSTAE